MNNKPVSYLQTDPRWSKLPYQTSRETATIGGSGCGPTCMAMVIATLVDSSVTPVTTCNWSVNHGYKATGNGTYHSYFVPQAAAYGLECIKLNQTSLQYMYASDAKKYHDLAHDYVDDGYMVVSLQGPGLWTSGGTVMTEMMYLSMILLVRKLLELEILFLNYKKLEDTIGLLSPQRR